GAQLLPDRRSLLYTVAVGTNQNWNKAQVVVQRLGSLDRRTIIGNGVDAHYLPTGHIIYADGGALFAVPFDMRRLQVAGGSVAVVEGGARSTQGLPQFAVSRTGSLIYVPGPTTIGLRELDLALLDLKSGAVEKLNLPPRAYQIPRFSPDGRQLAFSIDDGREANVWVYDLSGASSI